MHDEYIVVQRKISHTTDNLQLVSDEQGEAFASATAFGWISIANDLYSVQLKTGLDTSLPITKIDVCRQGTAELVLFAMQFQSGNDNPSFLSHDELYRVKDQVAEMIRTAQHQIDACESTHRP